MAEISIGAAVGEGFELIRKRPWTVVGWGATQLGISLLGLLIMFPAMAAIYGPMIKSMMAGAPPTPPNPADMSGVMQMQALSYLYDLISLFGSALLYCAVFRSVLHPQQSRFAYLRVGAAELFLFLLLVGGAIAFFIGLIAVMIPIGVVAAIMFGLHAAALGTIVSLVGGLAAIAAMVFILIRVSLIGPMMVDDGQFHFADAWALTRGKVAPLFALALVILLIVLAIELVLGVAFLALGFGVLSAVAGGVASVPTFFQQGPGVVLPKLVPFLAVAGLVGIPIAGCLLAIMGAPWARAYRDLKPMRDVAETFA